MLEVVRVIGMLLGIGWVLVLLWLGITVARAMLTISELDDEEPLVIRQAREIVEMAG